MKTILIATDFSHSARNAAVYGAKLAEALEAKVVLLNVFQSVTPSVDTAIMITDQEMRKEAMERLTEELNWLSSNFDGVQMEKRIEQGLPGHKIGLVAKQTNASWIIAGMRGGSKFVRSMFGSVALSLSRHTPVPLILVPGQASFKCPKKSPWQAT